MPVKTIVCSEVPTETPVESKDEVAADANASKDDELCNMPMTCELGEMIIDAEGGR